VEHKVSKTNFLSRIMAARPFQRAYVYPDIDKQIPYFTETLGAGLFMRIHDVPVQDQCAYGKRHHSRQSFGFSFLGDTNIELCQPIEGPSICTEFLDRCPEGGLHHIGWQVDSHEASVAAMAAAGYQEAHSGRFGEGTRFSYFDLREPLGHFVELISMDQASVQMFDELREKARLASA
jgi:methylmalonyl-CoA/ethylmalonyl-CoA epimerase